MLSKNEIRHGMITVLGVFIAILLYKVFLNGSNEALQFTPLVVIWLVITCIVLFATRTHNSA